MNNQEQLTPRQQFIKDEEERIELKKHLIYLKCVEKQRIRHEKGVLKYNKKNGIIKP